MLAAAVWARHVALVAVGDVEMLGEFFLAVFAEENVLRHGCFSGEIILQFWVQKQEGRPLMRTALPAFAHRRFRTTSQESPVDGQLQSPATGSAGCCLLMGEAALFEAGRMELRLTRPSTGFSPRTCSR